MKLLSLKTLSVGTSLAALTLSVSANAVVITSLPGGTAVPFPVLDQNNISTPYAIAPGIEANPSPGGTYTPGWTGNYNFPSNGSWSGTSMIGLDDSDGYFTIDFDNPISAFLGELNWTTGQTSADATIEIYNGATLLESLTLESGGANSVAPGFYGFSRASDEITSIRFNNEFIGVRNFSISMGNAVPEPATWAMMLLGFFAVGAALRTSKSGRVQTRVRYS